MSHAATLLITDNVSATVEVTNDIDLYPIVNQSYQISVNFTNISSGLPLTSPSSFCQVDFNGTPLNLTYNSSSQAFTETFLFDSEGASPLTVLCNTTGANGFGVSGSNFTNITIFPQYLIEFVNQTQLGLTTYLIPTIIFTVGVNISNLTGVQNSSLPPSSVNSATCNLSSLFENLNLTFQSGLYFGNVSTPSAGIYSYNTSCLVDGDMLNLTNQSLSVQSYRTEFEDSGLSFGSSSGLEQALLLLPETNELGVTQSSEINFYNLSNGNAYETISSSFFFEGVSAFFDYSNSGERDFGYVGNLYSSENLFQRTGNSFLSLFGITELSSYIQPTLSVFDSNNDGSNTLIITELGSKPTLVLEQNSTGFQAVQTLQSANEPIQCYFDANGDDFFDLYYGGDNGSLFAGIYHNSNGTFVLNTSLTGLADGSCVIGFITNDSRPDLLVYGRNASSISNQDDIGVWLYEGLNWSNPTSFNTQFSGLVRSSVILADFDNDGLSDFVVCGENASATAQTRLYHNNGNGTFKEQNLFNNSLQVSQCSLSATDYDKDGDLDLALAGVGGSNPIVLLNNTFTQFRVNKPPNAPTAINVTYNATERTLFLNWTQAVDDLTASYALSYNIEIENAVGDLLVSGKYPVSSNPVQGFLGNMQYRTNFTLRNVSASNFIARVQAIDNGFQHSTWTAGTYTLTDCLFPQNGSFMISAIDCLISEDLESNASIIIEDNGSLRITSPVSLIGNVGFNVANGSLILDSNELNGSGNTITIDANGLLDLQSQSVLRNLSLQIRKKLTLGNVTFENSSLTANQSSVILENVVGASLGVDQAVITELRTVEFNVTNSSGNQLGVTISNGTSLNVSQLLVYQILNTSGSFTPTHNISFTAPLYYLTNVLISNFSGTLNITLNRTPLPDSSEFDFGTNFTALLTNNSINDFANFSNLSNVTIGKRNVASITYQEPLNLTFVNLSQFIVLGENSVFVNSSAEPRLNQSANVTLFNVSYNKQPLIYRDGEFCADCQNITFNSSQVSFTVLGFSNFTSGANAQLASGNQSRFIVNQSQAVAFVYANASNVSQLVSDGLCSISTNNSDYSGASASFVSNIGHIINLNLTTLGDVLLNVSCVGSTNFEPLNFSAVVSVYVQEPQFYLNQALTGVGDSGIGVFENGTFLYAGELTNGSFYSSSDQIDAQRFLTVAIADLNNDGFEDVVSLGQASTASSLSYRLGGSSLSVELDQLFRGDLQLVDFDNDGDVDIFACGFDANNSARTKIYRNTFADSGYVSLGFVELAHNLSNVARCFLTITDVDKDGWNDVVLFGGNASDARFGEYHRNEQGNYTLNETLQGLQFVSTIAWDFDQDGDEDFILNGENASFAYQTLVYQNNNGTLSQNTTLSSQLLVKDDAVITKGAIGNESQLFISGTFGADEIQSVRFNGTDFVQTQAASLITPVQQGAAIIYDLDQDNQPELFLTGKTDTDAITHIYQSTGDLLGQSRTPPLAPTVNASYDTSLSLNFTNATQVLYRVGHLSNPNAYISGARGSPILTIRANVNLRLPENCLIIQAQSIDEANLRSNWSTPVVLNNRTEVRGNGIDEDCDGIAQPNLPTVTVSRTSGSSSFRQSVEQSAEAQTDSTPAPEPKPETPTERGSSSKEDEPKPLIQVQKEFEQRFEITQLNDRTKIVERIKNIERTPKQNIVVRKTFPKAVMEAASTLISPNDYEIIIEDPVLDFHLGDLDYLEEKTIVYTIPGLRNQAQVAQIESDFTAVEELTESQIQAEEEESAQTAEEAFIVDFTETETDNGTVYTISLDLEEEHGGAEIVEVEQIIPKCILEEVNEQLLERIIDPELIDSVEIKEADPIIVWNLERVDQYQELQLKLDTFREEDCEDEFKVNVLAQNLISANLKADKTLLAFTYAGIIGAMALLFFILSLSHHKGKYHEKPHIHRLVKLILKRKHRGESDDQIWKNLQHNEENEADLVEAFDHLGDNEHLHHKHKIMQHLGELIIFVILLTISVLELVTGVSKEWDFLKKIISFVLMLFIFYKVDIVQMLFGQKYQKAAVMLLAGMFLMHLKNLVVFAAKHKSGAFSFLDNFYEHLVSSAFIYDSVFFWSGLLLVLAASILLSVRLAIKDGGLGHCIAKHPTPKHWWDKILRASWVFAFYMIFFITVFNRFMEWLAVAIDAVVYVLMTVFFLVHLFEVMHRKHNKHGFHKIMNVLAHQWVILSIGLLLLLLFLKEVIGFSSLWLIIPLGVLMLAAIKSWLNHKGHRLQDIEQLSSLSDTLYLRCAKLFKHPVTLPLGMMLILVLHLVVDTVIYLFANITGYRSHLYLGHEAELLLDMFSNHGLIARHLADFVGWDQVVYGLYYFLSIAGYFLLFALPFFVFAMYYTHRNTHMSRLDLAKTAFHNHGWIRGLSEMLVVVGIPLGALSLHSQIFKLVPFIGEGTVGVEFTPLQAMHTLGEVQLSLVIVMLVAFVSLFALKFRKWRDWQLRIALFAGIVAVGWVYFYPFYESVIDALVRQFMATQNAATWSIMWANLIQFVFNVLDFIVVYVIAAMILLVLLIPTNLRRKVIKTVLRALPMRVRSEFASDLHYLHYFKDSREHDAGNIVHHLKHFVEHERKEGYSDEELRAYILKHGYPEDVVGKVISARVR